MIRWLQIPTAVVLLALLANPVEGNEGNDDLGTGVSWRRAVLNAIQAACAGKSPSLCPAPDRSTASDSTRTAPASPPRTGGRTGPASEGGWRWGPYGEFRSFTIERLNVRSSTATVTFFQGGQQVQQQQIDNTDSIRANYSFRATNYAGTIGIWAALEKSRIAAEARGGVLFGDAEIEQTGIQLNTVTKTGGNDWGGSFEARIQAQAEADSRLFVYAESNVLWLNFDGVRDPVESISGAAIESDTSDVTLRLFTAGAGAGFFLDADRKYSVRAGAALHSLDVQSDRSLQFLFTALNQRVVSKGRLRLERNAPTFDASIHGRPLTYLDIEGGASLGPGVRNVFVRSSLNW